MKVIIL